MDWIPCEVRQKVCIAKLWNHLLDGGKQAGKKDINWDQQMTGPWPRDVCTLFCNNGFGEESFKSEKIKLVCPENACLLSSDLMIYGLNHNQVCSE